MDYPDNKRAVFERLLEDDSLRYVALMAVDAGLVPVVEGEYLRFYMDDSSLDGWKLDK